MVLWEITLGTAYFLGLKRTYRLALRIQRRVISPNHPKISQFVHRRTRAVFDVAFKVHRSIQERDIEIGQNLGNWVLRWLDRMKQSAQKIPAPGADNGNTSITKLLLSNSYSQQRILGGFQRFSERSWNRDSGSQFLTYSRNIWSKRLPTIAMMMLPAKRLGTNIQYRHISSTNSPEAFGYRQWKSWVLRE